MQSVPITPPRALAADPDKTNRTRQALRYALLSALIAVLAATVFYVLHPLPVADPDTRAYILGVTRIVGKGQFVHTRRLPGYPLVLTATFLLTHSYSPLLVSRMQGVLFIGVALETFALATLVWRHLPTAALCSALVASSAILLTHAQAILTEGVGVFLLTSLALLAVFTIRTARISVLWAMGLCLLLLEITRPEWVYLSIPLLLWVGFLTYRRMSLRVLLPNALALLLLVNGVMGLYVYRNASVSGFAGITDIQNINLLGKVMQYHMQDEAPAQYAGLSHLLDSYVARGDLDPWHVFAANYPPLNSHHFALAQHYAVAIFLRHPVQFAADTIVLLWSTFTPDSLQSTLGAQAAISSALALWWQISALLLEALVAFPLLAVFWGGRAVLRHRPLTEPEALLLTLIGIAGYGLAITTVGDYVAYGRLHTVFDPLMIVVMWGSLALAVRKARDKRLVGRVGRWKAFRPSAGGRS